MTARRQIESLDGIVDKVLSGWRVHQQSRICQPFKEAAAAAAAHANMRMNVSRIGYHVRYFYESENYAYKSIHLAVYRQPKHW